MANKKPVVKPKAKPPVKPAMPKGKGGKMC